MELCAQENADLNSECAAVLQVKEKGKNAALTLLALSAERMMTKQYNKEAPSSIQKMFGTIAKQYDRTNAILSFNLHQQWNRKLASFVKNPKKYLDLCAGTGEIAFTVLRKHKKPVEVYLLDFCQEMLDQARLKELDNPFILHKIHYIQADAQKIPLASDSIDCVTIAYGIRNVQDPALCIKEAYRVLRPGGTFAILELTQPNNPILRLGHRIYLKTFMPLIGKMAASNKDAYRYLCQSIHSFVSSDRLEKILKEQGFKETTQLPLTGGIATIISGRKF